MPRTAGGKLRRDAVRALVDDGPAGILARPGGDEIGWRVTGSGSTPVVLLPGTLSNAAQLDRLATELARPGDATRPRHRPARHGDVEARRIRPRWTSTCTFATSLAYLDARGIERAAVVGVSFGAVVALEAAARHPERVQTLVAWEPPYGPLGDDASRARFARIAADTARAYDDRRSGRRGGDVPARGRRRRGLGPAPAEGPRLPRPRG